MGIYVFIALEDNKTNPLCKAMMLVKVNKFGKWAITRFRSRRKMIMIHMHTCKQHMNTHTHTHAHTHTHTYTCNTCK